MTNRERMLTTLRHGKADMVPCCPDISIMVPLKLKNKPFWSFYVDEDKGTFEGIYDNENLFNAYVDACDYFGTIAWAWYLSPIVGEKKTIKNGKAQVTQQGDVTYRTEILESNSSRVVSRTTMTTPDGELWSETVYPDDNPPFPVRKFIKDLKEERFRRVVMVDPGAGFEGRLAKEILTRHRLWDKLQGRLIMARSAEHMLTFLTTREADAAIGFESSLTEYKGLVILQRFDDKLDTYLMLCGTVMKQSKSATSAKAFLDLFESRQCALYGTPGVYRTSDD